MSLSRYFLVFCFLFFLFQFNFPFTASADTGCYSAIYSFGDSITDTGNLLHSSPHAFEAVSGDTYGETYFNKPTGRFSNGRLIVDFIAEAYALPLLHPYLEKDAPFEHGVNFAVAGATALDSSFFENNKIEEVWSNNSLTTQVKWFNKHLSTLCSSHTECRNTLENALFLVGEIGVNDYTYAIFQGKNLKEVETYVPQVVQAIKNALRTLIHAGATQLVVPGNFPIGCLPSYLTLFQTRDPKYYDELTMCFKPMNHLAELHNSHLQDALTNLREEFPQAVIIYADYYNAFLELLHKFSDLGFGESNLMEACCGTGGTYNFDANNLCGAPGVGVCSNPSVFIHWDGLHLTEMAHQYIAMWLITSGYTSPPIQLPGRC